MIIKFKSFQHLPICIFSTFGCLNFSNAPICVLTTFTKFRNNHVDSAFSPSKNPFLVQKLDTCIRKTYSVIIENAPIKWKTISSNSSVKTISCFFFRMWEINKNYTNKNV